MLLAPSVTCTVNESVSAVSGVPPIAPVDVFSVRPAFVKFEVPARMLQV